MKTEPAFKKVAFVEVALPSGPSWRLERQYNAYPYWFWYVLVLNEPIVSLMGSSRTSVPEVFLNPFKNLPLEAFDNPNITGQVLPSDGNSWGFSPGCAGAELTTAQGFGA